MTDFEVSQGRFLGTGREWRQSLRRAGRAAFGDRLGLTLWLGLVVALGLTWRVGFFITDSYAIANALVAVADGHLAITEIQYSLTLGSQPGLSESGGRLYGRNYGQVFLALPFVWALQAASFIAPLHLVLAGGWSLAMLAFGRQIASVTGRPAVRGIACVAALGAFGVNALSTAPLHPDSLHLVALQLSTLVAAAFGGVLFYRLVGVFHHRRVAAAAGVAVVVAFPIGFWASIPKRHVLVATLLIGSVFCFARSRQTTGRQGSVSIAGAYLLVALVAWVHAFEGFFALAMLGSVDLLTGGIRDRRRLAVVACALVIGLVPMFLTNVLVAGNPLEPPRLLPGPGNLELAPGGEVRATDGANAGSGQSDPMGSSTGGGSSDSAGSGGGSGSGGGNPFAILAPLLEPIRGPLAKVTFILGFVVTTVTDGVAVLGEGERLWHIFGRSGRIPGLKHSVNGYEMIDLTVLESAPLLGGLLTLPVLFVRTLTERFHERRMPLPWDLSPRRQTDLLVVALGTLLTVIYLSRLPLFSMITVRYVVYAMPFWLYGVVRLPPVREAVTEAPKRVGLTYATVAIGGVLLTAFTLGTLHAAVGEAMQFHALVNLAAAALVAVLVGGRALVPNRVRVEWVASGLAAAAGSTTAFLLLAGVEYFQYGPFALGVARRLSAAIPIL